MISTRHTIIHKGDAKRLAIEIENALLPHCLTDTLHQTAMGLAMHDHRVDRTANIIDRSVASDAHMTSLRIHFSLANMATIRKNRYVHLVSNSNRQRVFAEARNLDSWAACRAMAVQAVATVPARRVDAILNGMSGGGYINRGDQEELLRGAAAAGLSAEHQANFIAGSDTVAEQQSADAQNADAVVLGAAGAAAQLAHAARAALRGTLRG